MPKAIPFCHCDVVSSTVEMKGSYRRQSGPHPPSFLAGRSRNIDTTMTTLVFACQPDTCAYDGRPGENGVYTGALLQALSEGAQLTSTQVIFLAPVLCRRPRGPRA